ncbi:thioredoxin family protein [Jannaschia sp. AI_61]|uniref:DUF1223 domain-containing protein n=1 Tax=Jannaschia sp. AI_61 TaxID=2829796 RepID=UPI0021044E04|nr:DUF1223 domain-containing protein [Jannaschia sp. AI_61]
MAPSLGVLGDPDWIEPPMRFLPLALVSLLALPAAADPVVVELYTSQGCSSCPPADDMLGMLAERDDVIALSLHVDYWDWIGWADTFADPAHSERQRLYASAAGSSVVYTPQFVIGGRDQVAGPSGMQLAEMIDAHQAQTTDMLRLASSADGKAVTAMPRDGGAQIILVTVEPKATVRISHGENAGKKITYHNIVRSWDPLVEWSGEERLSVVLPEAPEGLSQIVLAQTVVDGKPGPVLGAVRAD